MRKRFYLESDLDNEQKNWPRFLIIEFLDEGRDLTKLSSLSSQTSKAIHAIAGGDKDIKKL